MTGFNKTYSSLTDMVYYPLENCNSIFGDKLFRNGVGIFCGCRKVKGLVSKYVRVRKYLDLVCGNVRQFEKGSRD